MNFHFIPTLISYHETPFSIGKRVLYAQTQEVIPETEPQNSQCQDTIHHLGGRTHLYLVFWHSL